jgi:hypothetical protein
VLSIITIVVAVSTALMFVALLLWALGIIDDVPAGD